MKKGLKLAGWGSVILLLLVIIFLPKILQGRRDKAVKKAKTAIQQAARVKVMVLQAGPIREYLKTTGTLLADEEVDLTFEGQGKIETIFFREGSRVKKGDILARLNDEELQAQLVKLNLQHNLLQEMVSRQKVLLEKEAISQESYDQLMTQLQSNEAEIKLIRVLIDKMQIKAPFDGIIGLRYVSEGAYVSQNTRIARLMKIQPLKVEFAVPERYAGIIREGSSLSFRLDNGSEAYEARVYATEPAVDPGTRTMTLRAFYANSDGGLHPGRFVSVMVTIREKNDALQVPTEAVIPELGGEKVYTVVRGRAISVPVTIGMRTREAVEIIKGLQPGDSVITSGIMQLRSDMPVSILAEDSVSRQKPLP